MPSLSFDVYEMYSRGTLVLMRGHENVGGQRMHVVSYVFDSFWFLFDVVRHETIGQVHGRGQRQGRGQAQEQGHGLGQGQGQGNRILGTAEDSTGHDMIRHEKTDHDRT